MWPANATYNSYPCTRSRVCVSVCVCVRVCNLDAWRHARIPGRVHPVAYTRLNAAVRGVTSADRQRGYPDSGTRSRKPIVRVRAQPRRDRCRRVFGRPNADIRRRPSSHLCPRSVVVTQSAPRQGPALTFRPRPSPKATRFGRLRRAT